MEAVAHAPPAFSHGVPFSWPRRAAAAPVGLGAWPLDATCSKLLSASRSSRKPVEWSLASRRVASIGVKATLMTDDLDVVPTTSMDPVDQQQGDSVLTAIESIEDQSSVASSPSGFSPDPPFTFDLSSAAASRGSNYAQVLMESMSASIASDNQLIDRAINASIVGLVGVFAITKILTVDHDYWHGWTILEILKYAPLHNWSAYEEALSSNPILAKMMISGAVYAAGDWIAQCYEGKAILEISRKRVLRSGLVGFCLHGSLSHFYYHICEALFPFRDWWAVPIKVAFDQTIWSAIWNSVYFVTLGVLRLESPASIASELSATFWPMLTAGWKLWPFAHLITYGVVPVEQRLLWVDCVELVWVTILSMYSNEKAEARIQDVSVQILAKDEHSTCSKGDEL